MALPFKAPAARRLEQCRSPVFACGLTHDVNSVFPIAFTSAHERTGLSEPMIFKHAYS